MDKEGLTLDEMTILVRSVLVSSKKIDKNFPITDIKTAEKFAQSAFNASPLFHDGIITLEEYLHWCSTNKEVINFSKFWVSEVAPLAFAPGEVWHDTTFPPCNKSLYKDEIA